MRGKSASCRAPVRRLVSQERQRLPQMLTLRSLPLFHPRRGQGEELAGCRLASALTAGDDRRHARLHEPRGACHRRGRRHRPRRREGLPERRRPRCARRSARRGADARRLKARGFLASLCEGHGRARRGVDEGVLRGRRARARSTHGGGGQRRHLSQYARPRHDHGGVGPRHGHQRARRLPHLPGGRPRHGRARHAWQDHHALVGRRPERTAGRRPLLRLQGGRGHVHEGAGPRDGEAPHQRQLHRSRPHRGEERDVAADQRVRGDADALDSVGTDRDAGGHCQRRAVSGLPPGRVHHGGSARRQWRLLGGPRLPASEHAQAVVVASCPAARAGPLTGGLFRPILPPVESCSAPVTRMEVLPMIYEIRTYTLKTRSLAEVEKRYGEAYEYRKKYSPLAAFWHTEVGPLNEIVQVWPYRDLAERTRIRAEASKDPNRPPKIREFVVNQDGQLITRFPFIPEITPGTVGPIFEMRCYSLTPGSLPGVMKRWEGKIAERAKLSPIVMAGGIEFGQANRFLHIWA